VVGITSLSSPVIILLSPSLPDTRHSSPDNEGKPSSRLDGAIARRIQPTSTTSRRKFSLPAQEKRQGNLPSYIADRGHAYHCQGMGTSQHGTAHLSIAQELGRLSHPLDFVLLSAVSMLLPAQQQKGLLEGNRHSSSCTYFTLYACKKRGAKREAIIGNSCFCNEKSRGNIKVRSEVRDSLLFPTYCWPGVGTLSVISNHWSCCRPSVSLSYQAIRMLSSVTGIRARQLASDSRGNSSSRRASG
jgi:hypothetical protein